MSISDSIITYGSPSSEPSFQHINLSAFSFEVTVNRLKNAIEAESLWLLHKIDPQILLKRGGFEIFATRQLLFFHPRYMKRLLAIDPNALIEAPLKFVVMQMPDGLVTVRYTKVEIQFNRYSGFEELTEELANICERLVHEVST